MVTGITLIDITTLKATSDVALYTCTVVTADEIVTNGIFVTFMVAVTLIDVRAVESVARVTVITSTVVITCLIDTGCNLMTFMSCKKRFIEAVDFTGAVSLATFVLIFTNNTVTIVALVASTIETT